MTTRNRSRAAIVAAMGAAVALAAFAVGGAQGRAIGAYTTKGTWSFRSAPALHPPKVRADTPTITRRLAPGYFLAATTYGVGGPQLMTGQGGPLILDSRLRPVWVKPIGTKALAFNLQEQRYHGRPVLTWWQGVVTRVGVPVRGEDIVVDDHYREIGKPLRGADGWVISVHDFVISGHNAWVTAYKSVSGVDLSPYGGPQSGSVLDSAVQEYDLTSGRLLYTWDLLNPGGKPNVPLSDSKQPLPADGVTAWDAYHLNSIQVLASGRVLVSARNTWSAYLLEVPSGNIVWTLSGDPKLSSFSLPPNARFHWQHSVLLQRGNVISIYDDACCGLANGKVGPASGPSRGLLLKLDLANRTGLLRAQYTRGRHFDTYFLGSMQPLAGGNALVGWGSLPFFSEFSRSGRVLLDARWPAPDISYRVFLEPWAGTPSSPPSGAVRRAHGRTTVYASWNGATKVAAWRVLAGASTGHLNPAVARVPKAGFETEVPLTASYKVFRVQALDRGGRVLGTSRPF